MSKNLWLNKKPESILDWVGVIFASIAFYLFLGHIDLFVNAGGKILGILTPFAWGIVLAYILDPIARTVSHYLLHDNKKMRWVSILVAYIVGIAVIVLLLALVVPQVVSSVTILLTSIPGYISGLQETLQYVQDNFGLNLSSVEAILDNYEALMKEVYSVASSWAPEIVGYLGGVATNVVTVFTALASSIYMLFDKEKLLRQMRTLVHAFLPGNVAANTLRICSFANRNFSGFFIGKIIDSAIIWLICFIWFTIVRLNFTPLISVVVGITNIIPVFGPFIGAIPCFVILLFVDPIQALIFLVSILVIQQLDGNFIGPKILGQSIGISALWVLFSIVLGGDLLGIVGMVLGVPVFATFYGLLREFLQWCLDRRGIDAGGNPLPTVTAADDAPAPEDATEGEPAPAREPFATL